MTQILIPFKYYTYENLQKVERIGFYPEELSNIYNMCSKCLSIHDRHSKFCQACSDEFKTGDEKSYVARLKKNQESIDKYTKETQKKEKNDSIQLNRFGRVVAVLSSDPTEIKETKEEKPKKKVEGSIKVKKLKKVSKVSSQKNKTMV
jgi:HD superfamily phosphohydrolase